MTSVEEEVIDQWCSWWRNGNRGLSIARVDNSEGKMKVVDEGLAGSLTFVSNNLSSNGLPGLSWCERRG